MFGRKEQSGGSYFPPLCCFKRTSLIVRLVDRRSHRHLVFRARAADVHVPLIRDLAVRIAVESDLD